MKDLPALHAADDRSTAAVHAQAWLQDDVEEGVRRGAAYADDWRYNRLLAALMPDHRQRWLAQAECVYLRPGQMLHEAAAFIQWVYFPITALVSLSVPDRAGACAEVATAAAKVSWVCR